LSDGFAMTDQFQIPAFPLKILNPPEKFPPVNRCIYCGSYSNKLADEHIIPFGLAGNALILRKASCKTCESITGGFEQTCLRTILGPFRIRVGAPTRNPKDRPEKLSIALAKSVDGKPVETGKVEIESKDFPLVFLGLRLRPPGILEGLPVSSNLNGEIWSRFNTEEAKKQNLVPSVGEPAGFKLGQINPVIFGRMLAKIAYSYGVAKVGYGAFRPLPLRLILEKTDTMCHWVGGDWEIPPVESTLHRLEVYKQTAFGRTFLVVSIRLFSFYETPLYRVVVGDFPDPQYQISFTQQILGGNTI
jgi:hypothetical protein